MSEHGQTRRDDVSSLFNVLLPDTPMTDLLDRVTELAARTVGNCTFAGITVGQDGSMETPVYTDERSPRVDQVQYDAGTGPCVDAFRTGEVKQIHDTATEQRWRAFCDAALDEHIRSTLSVPLDVSGNRTEVLGALNLYSEVPDAFDDEARASTESFAQQAAIVMANARAYWGVKELSDQLQVALESRATIEQAKGILIAQSQVSPEDAFKLLVRASQRENRKLREIAAEIVERAQRPRA
jgi:GAF domain-containing protein